MSFFREFASSEDLWEAGFLPVPAYRVCDGWNDYHTPWSDLPPPIAPQPSPSTNPFEFVP